MNFYRKKNRIVASFGEKELNELPSEILKNLNSLLPIEKGKELRISIAENKDMKMEIFSVIAAFSTKLLLEGTSVELRAQSELAQCLNILNLNDCFTAITSGD